MKLGFIGAGKVGTGLSVSLNKKFCPVVAVYDIKKELAENLAQNIHGCEVVESTQGVVDKAECVFITTPDAFIEQVCNSVRWRPKQKVFHCSGANTVHLLNSAKDDGAYVGVFHPGLSFADYKLTEKNIAGSTFDIEAEDPALGLLKEMATALDSYWISIKAEEKPVYHVAVEFASLFVMLLFRVSVDMLGSMGITKENAIKAVLPMIKGTAKNIERLGTSQPLTGPADRGDNDTIEKHIDGLARIYPSVLPLYRELVRQNIFYATQHGVIDTKKALELKTLINNLKI